MVNAQGILELWNHRFLELCDLQPIEANKMFSEVMQSSSIALPTPHSVAANGTSLLQKEQRLVDGRMVEIRIHPLPSGVLLILLPILPSATSMRKRCVKVKTGYA